MQKTDRKKTKLWNESPFDPKKKSIFATYFSTQKIQIQHTKRFFSSMCEVGLDRRNFKLLYASTSIGNVETHKSFVFKNLKSSQV